MQRGLLRMSRDAVAGSLRMRIMLMVLAAFLVVAAPAAWCFSWLVDHTVIRLGTLFAEKQILYDRYRGLEALTREVALAETLARSPVVMEWAQDEFDRDRYARGIAELEHFRRTFSDQSYFFVIGRSGNYYYNDRQGSYTGAQRRYTLSPENPRDGWYYTTAAQGAGCHLNVDHDDNLAVTKVWINCVVVAEDGQPLGILGTGIDLTDFIRNVVETDQSGVESMFVDRSGAIQANRNESLIDFHSLTKDSDAKTTFFQLLDRDSDRAALRAMMEEVADDDANAAARFLQMDGHRTLVGIGYLDKLGWYNVTVMDVDRIIDRRLFLPIGLLLVAMMVSVALLLGWLFKRAVLDRLARLEGSLASIERGDRDALVEDHGRDEVGRLADALNRMATAVSSRRASLEDAVRERTEQLERIAYLDPLTGVLNRRGLVEAFAQFEAHGRRTGVLILDIDRFKSINDANGHLAGDTVISEVAKRLIDVTREGDICARWGGDEFVLLLRDCSPRLLTETGSRVLQIVRRQPVQLPDGSPLHVTTSIGAHIAQSGEALEAASVKADRALYAAKSQGRNRMVVYDASHHAGFAPARVA
jgi:diguanylate cyclase (GGDEF)-like protein